MHSLLRFRESNKSKREREREREILLCCLLLFLLFFFFFFFRLSRRRQSAFYVYDMNLFIHFQDERGCGYCGNLNNCRNKRGLLQVNFSVVCIFLLNVFLGSLLCASDARLFFFRTRLAHSSPRQSRIFILHFLCLVATTSLTRSSSLVPSWPTPCLKNRNRRF